MISLSSPTKRTLIRVSYLCPLIGGFLLWIYFAIPHLYFIQGNLAYDTWSTFDLVSNTMRECVATLSGATEGTSDAIYFAYTVGFFAILFWVALIAYTVTALAAAICSFYAFSKEPTSKESNRAKRYFRFLCPNRPTYVLCNLALLLAAAFPHILTACYHRQMGYADISLHFFFMPDLLLAAIAVLFGLVPYLALLPTQAKEHMDLFRLYKAR